MPAFSTRNSTEPPFGALYGADDIHGNRADARVRHQAARAQNLTEPADEAHHVGRRNAAIEVDRALRHLIDEILRADEIGTGGLGLLGLRPTRKHSNARGAPGAVGQIADAAHHLVGVLGVDAEVHRHLDRLVELRLGALLDELHRLLDRV